MVGGQETRARRRDDDIKVLFELSQTFWKMKQNGIIQLECQLPRVFSLNDYGLARELAIKKRANLFELSFRLAIRS